jgi:hypothetical protein
MIGFLGNQDADTRPVLIMLLQPLSQPVHLDANNGVAFGIEAIRPPEGFGGNGKLLQFLRLTAETLLAEIEEQTLLPL